MSEENKRAIPFEKPDDSLEDLLANPFGEQDRAEETRGEQSPKRMIDVLPEEHRQKALQLAKQIDPENHEAITAYGTEAQSKLLNFSHAMLDHVQKKDLGPIGDILKDLMKKLEQTNPDELQRERKNVLARWFGKISGSINETLSKYQKVGAQVDRISVKLEHAKKGLVDDIHVLEKLYEQNKEYFQALNVYIAAAQVKLEELNTKVIPALKQKAEASGDQMAYQEVNDMVQFANRLEKRVHDLEVSRQVTIQSAPQIRLIQHTNQALAEKIQSSIMTAIPLWKNQIAIALTLFRQKQAVEAQRQVSDTTNELLIKNSEMLKANTVATAKENERGLVDMETLQQTQANLISTLEETIAIQQEGRAKRRQAEQALLALENELKQKLIELK
ncbi:toxic anion resistance protein [Novibacillus thermophilus]|uniref:Toxic anion resistance protein n=1 Tax=Novibacillus thermophilus TaxID=1471761 RepID=A0A1U9K3N6_9BACL|nr:toxic anion resistance protein [Novibacillus thermophilus]AQS54634.1 toxic anion resistance protein [Novibacillus thermophilus]